MEILCGNKHVVMFLLELISMRAEGANIPPSTVYFLFVLFICSCIFL